MWFVWSGSGLFGVGFFYALVAYISAVTIAVGAVAIGEIAAIPALPIVVPYVVAIACGVVMHGKCMLTDPGTIAKDSATEAQASLSTFCTKCRCLKSHRAHHCSICSRCVMRMDHHCPWINNCVGLVTQKHFLLFLLYTLVAALYSVVVLIVRAALCSGATHSQKEVCSAQRPTFRLEAVLGVSAAVAAGIFVLFLGLMLFDQLTRVLRNTTGIERLQQVLTPSSLSVANLSEVCGETFSYRWFLPVSVSPPVPDPLLGERELT